VDLPEGCGHGDLRPLDTAQPIVSRTLCLVFVERAAGHALGERRRRASEVDRRLGALGLQLVQNDGEIRYLTFF